MKKNLLYFIILIALSTLFSACSKVSDEDLRIAHKAYENGALIIDVRTKEEYKEKHIQKAVNIALHNLEKYYKYIPQNKAIIVYCATWSRSSMATEFLIGKGRTVYDVATQEDWERELPQITK